jgi:hypothetical protein
MSGSIYIDLRPAYGQKARNSPVTVSRFSAVTEIRIGNRLVPSYPAWQRQVLVSSIKGEVKKKHPCAGRNFSCFSAHWMEQDLFCKRRSQEKTPLRWPELFLLLSPLDGAGSVL